MNANTAKNRVVATQSHKRSPNPKRKRRRSRSRSRRRNPWDGHDALTTGAGAGIGSLVGGVVGGAIGFGMAAHSLANTEPFAGDELPMSGMFAAPGLAWAGSIVGGAIGGHIGAPDKIEGRGTAGGALGGMFGPIGAAAGGAIAGGYKHRKSNPTPLGWAAIAVAGIAAVTGTAYAVKKWRKAAALTPGSSMGGDTTEPPQ